MDITIDNLLMTATPNNGIWENIHYKDKIYKGHYNFDFDTKERTLVIWPADLDFYPFGENKGSITFKEQGK